MSDDTVPTCRIFHTGDFPEVDEKGQEKWPKGDETTWKTAMRDLTAGKFLFSFLALIAQLTLR